MSNTIRFTVEGNKITLFVKKSPLLIRVVLLLLAFLCVVLPLMGIVMNAMEGNDFHLKYLLALGVFSLLGFFLLRLFLWNSYGKEVIEINDSSLTYYADYYWFKGNQQQLSMEELTIDFVAVGFREEQIGQLLFISSETILLESSVNMPIPDLIKIIDLFTKPSPCR